METLVASRNDSTTIRARGVDAGVDWWLTAWRLFIRAPITWIVLLVAGVVLSFLADRLLERYLVLNFAFSLLLGTVFVAAVLAVARALDRKQPVTLGDVFAAFGNRFLPLIVLTLAVSIGFALCVVIGAGVVQLIFGAGLADAWRWIVDAQQATTTEELMSVMAKHDPLPLLMAAWFAPALVLFPGDGPFTALRKSLVAALKNVVPFLIYGALGLVLAIVASAPILLGWILLAPVMMITLYTSYADVFAVDGS